MLPLKKTNHSILNDIITNHPYAILISASVTFSAQWEAVPSLIPEDRYQDIFGGGVWNDVKPAARLRCFFVMTHTDRGRLPDWSRPSRMTDKPKKGEATPT